MTGLRYTRSGGAAPRDHEVLVVSADGRYTLWRTIGWNGVPVGSFAGTIDLDALPAGVALDDARLPLPADASLETVEFAGATLVGPDDGVPPASWRPVVETARAWLDALTAAPVAALALRSGALVALGDQPLRVDLSRAHISAARWDGPAVVESWDGPLDSAGGWPVPVRMPLTGTVSVEVGGVRLHDGTAWRECVVSTPAQP